MPSQHLNADELFQRKLKGHQLYSQVVIAEGKKFVFIAGALSRDKDGNVVGVGDMRAQILQCAKNLRVALEVAGATLENLVRTTTYTTDIDEFFKYPEERAEIFGPALPTSTTVEVRRLSQKELMLEIEAVALLDK